MRSALEAVVDTQAAEIPRKGWVAEGGPPENHRGRRRHTTSHLKIQKPPCFRSARSGFRLWSPRRSFSGQVSFLNSSPAAVRPRRRSLHPSQPSSAARPARGATRWKQDCGQPRSTRLRCSMRPTRRGLTKPCLEPAKRLRQTATWSLRPQVLGETPSTTLRRSHACDAARRNCIDRGSICLHSTRQRNPTAGRAVGIREVDHIDIVLSQAEVRLLHV